MNFDTKTKSWLLVICTATASGVAAAGIAKAGGSTVGWCIVSGIGGAATAIGHAIMTSPNDKPTEPPMKNIGNP